MIDAQFAVPVPERLPGLESRGCGAVSECHQGQGMISMVEQEINPRRTCLCASRIDVYFTFLVCLLNLVCMVVGAPLSARDHASLGVEPVTRRGLLWGQRATRRAAVLPNARLLQPYITAAVSCTILKMIAFFLT